jgi:hypothetical protein
VPRCGPPPRAAAAGLQPDEAGTDLIISHGVYLLREDFTRHIETAAALDCGIPMMAWIDWDADITALDNGCLPSSAGENRVLRIAASLAIGHPVSLRDVIPGLDQRNLRLVGTDIYHAAGGNEALPRRPRTGSAPARSADEYCTTGISTRPQ